jgi:hypothetical protein
MKNLQIERKITVWSTEYVEYDDTKYTEEEFINQFHRVQNGYSDQKLEGCLYETYDYEIIQYSAEDITPEDNGNESTLLILNENGEELYDNNTNIYKGVV